MSEKFTIEELKKLTKLDLIHLIDNCMSDKIAFLEASELQKETAFLCHDCRSIAVKLGLV